MPWSMSHNAEAYENFSENIQRRPRKWLETVWSEWLAFEKDGGEERSGTLTLKRLRNAKKEVKKKNLPDDVLADAIAEKALARGLCENGGFQGWACPYGCNSHLVTFDNEEQEEAAALEAKEREEEERNEAREAVADFKREQREYRWLKRGARPR